MNINPKGSKFTIDVDLVEVNNSIYMKGNEGMAKMAVKRGEKRKEKAK
jgi:hypothetical protein